MSITRYKVGPWEATYTLTKEGYLYTGSILPQGLEEVVMNQVRVLHDSVLYV